MKIALTGATGFIGRYITNKMLSNSHQLNCWKRPQTQQPVMDDSEESVRWVNGDLESCDSIDELVANCDAVIHNAFWRPGEQFQGSEGDLVTFVNTNLIGTLKLIEAARRANVSRFIFVSSCAVHEKILPDRALDEAHPLWPTTHYGAHKAAIEKFVHSYGMGHGYDICAIRPTGVYGLHHVSNRSKWYDLISSVVKGETVECKRGGKEVHASDVANAIHLLLQADPKLIRGKVFACYDSYISHLKVARIAKEIVKSDAEIIGAPAQPKNQIDNSKIKSIGMEFGGEVLLRNTIQQIVDAVELK